MAVTFGFYDAVNGDRRYKAEEFSRLFEGIIRDGVFASIGTSLVVEAVGGMDVAIGVGRAWFENTWIDNDSPYIMKLDPAHISKNRIDAVVIEVDKNNRETIFKVVKGGEVEGVAENPVLTDHQYPLAYVSVSLGIYEVIQANITNMVGTEACPFISGVLETITIEGVTVLLEDEFNRWFDGVKGQLDEDAAGNLQNQINELNIIIPKAFTSSYQAFIENINTDSLDAAFGKNNENNIRYLGRQLAMYAWFMGEDPVLRPYVELQKGQSLTYLSASMFHEILSSSVLTNLMSASPYARNLIRSVIDQHIEVVEVVEVGSGILNFPEQAIGCFITMIGPGSGFKRGRLIQSEYYGISFPSSLYEISLNKTSFGPLEILSSEAINSEITLDSSKLFASPIFVGNNGNSGAGGANGGSGGGLGGKGGIQLPNHSICGGGGGGGLGGDGSGRVGGAGGAGGSSTFCIGGAGGAGGGRGYGAGGNGNDGSLYPNSGAGGNGGKYPSSGAGGSTGRGAGGGGGGGHDNSYNTSCGGGGGGGAGYGAGGGQGGASNEVRGGQGKPSEGAIVLGFLKNEI